MTPQHARPVPQRPWIGAALAAVPHVLILLVMVLMVGSNQGTDRAYAALIGVTEIYVVPVALVVALLLRLSSRWRTWSAGVVGMTLAGAVLVIILTLIVGNADTWR